jgi:putative DNA primase/helicase
LSNLPRIINLTDLNQRSTLFKLCQRFKDPDIGLLLCLDNNSVLFPGLDENAKKDWDPINTWLLDLKKSGVSSLYFHHQGKSGDQRGTTGHIDNIDTEIKLSLPKDYKTDDGCRFNLHFKKKRVAGDYLHLIQDQEWILNTKENPYEWVITTSHKKNSDEIFLLLAQGMGVREIARTLGLKDHAYVSRTKTKLTANGYFHVNGDLTEKGKERLNSSTKDDLEE